MASTFLWKIEGIQVKPQVGEFNDVVVSAAWRCNGNIDGDTYTAYGTCSFVDPQETSIPFVTLTEQMILQWCWEHGVSKIRVETAMLKQHEEKTNPETVSPNLPWA